MGKEWRIFFPLYKSDENEHTNIFSHPEILPKATDIMAHLGIPCTLGQAEIRTDNYILLPDINFGLKLRHADSTYPHLELKVRTKVLQDGTTTYSINNHSKGTENWANALGIKSSGVLHVRT